VKDNEFLETIRLLESRLEEAEQLIEAIKSGEVDAFAMGKEGKQEVFTIQSSDYAYRLLIEECGEGAINVTEEGIIVYTNRYFCQLLGLPYEKVAGSFISQFIEEESKAEFNNLFQQSITGKAKGEIFLWGNRRNIPVYVSLTSLQPRLPTVGIIITDLTEKKNQEKVIIAYQKNLELKNYSLGKMNTELQSFAHISSHDLQEPVRKIQIITSRILESEFENLSDHGKDLLLRMQNSARRMHTLIHDLLAYSTTNYEKTHFEVTGLQKLIEDVVEDFNDDSGKEKVIIKATNLCSVKIIPLHFRQVMHNLISNSLKFAKPNTIPTISINCSIAHGGEFDDERLLPNKLYCKITYRDDGIGFDSEYNERIFGLFQRLHSREKYKGTGMGLAIVKKIIENHNGYISAHGTLDEGASFDIYLPHD
jgi:PAS domain S-box-containing protein